MKAGAELDIALADDGRVIVDRDGVTVLWLAPEETLRVLRFLDACRPQIVAAARRATAAREAA